MSKNCIFTPGSERYSFQFIILIDGTPRGTIGCGGSLSLTLSAGPHTVALHYAGQDLGPGSGGPPEPIGPLALAPAGPGADLVREVPASRAAALCGRRLDWIEVLR